MVLNKLRLAERQRTRIKKKPLSFLTNDSHLFYNTSSRSRRADRRTESRIWTFLKDELSVQIQITDSQSFQFCRILTDALVKLNITERRALSQAAAVVFDFIKCTFIVVYYDDDMTECTDDDLHYPNSVDGFLKLLLGNSIRKLKSLLLSLLFLL